MHSSRILLFSAPCSRQPSVVWFMLLQALLLYYILFTKRQLSVKQFACMCLFFCMSAAPSFAQLVQVNSDLEGACFIQKWYLPLCLFVLPLTGPPFSNQNIPCVLLIHTAVKSADMSGGRPEVTLPQNPTPVLGL